MFFCRIPRRNERIFILLVLSKLVIILRNPGEMGPVRWSWWKITRAMLNLVYKFLPKSHPIGKRKRWANEGGREMKRNNGHNLPHMSILPLRTLRPRISIVCELDTSACPDRNGAFSLSKWSNALDNRRIWRRRITPGASDWCLSSSTFLTRLDIWMSSRTLRYKSRCVHSCMLRTPPVDGLGSKFCYLLWLTTKV